MTLFIQHIIFAKPALWQVRSDLNLIIFTQLHKLLTQIIQRLFSSSSIEYRYLMFCLVTIFSKIDF